MRRGQHSRLGQELLFAAHSSKYALIRAMQIEIVVSLTRRCSDNRSPDTELFNSQLIRATTVPGSSARSLGPDAGGIRAILN